MLFCLQNPQFPEVSQDEDPSFSAPPLPLLPGLPLLSQQCVDMIAGAAIGPGLFYSNWSPKHKDAN